MDFDAAAEGTSEPSRALRKTLASLFAATQGKRPLVRLSEEHRSTAASPGTEAPFAPAEVH